MRVRIALIAPIVYPVPPGDYGGTERVVDLLAGGLQRLGHDLRVFAAAGSRPDLPLAAGAPPPLPETPVHAYAQAEAAHVRRALAQAGDFDVVHDHTKQRGLQLADLSPVPILTTLHNPVTPSRQMVYAQRPHHPWVAISRAQARQLRGMNVVGVVPHGLDTSRYTYRERKGDYLLSLGRITPDKGVHRAIEVARNTGWRLIIAGPVAEGAETYYRQQILPHLDGDQIRYVGPVGGERKQRLLSRAAAMLFPIDWEEPFGLVVIEALACGTPVLATARGAVPEILTDERIGLAVSEPADLEAALPRVLACRPIDCRTHVARYFSAERMARDYLDIYDRLVAPTRRLAA